MRATSPRSTLRPRQRGLSLVELMIGIAIALVIAAAGATLFAAHLREGRSQVLEARLMQDLRTAADLVARDLRRAGFWGAAGDGVWRAGQAGVATNPYAALAPTSGTTDAVAFGYSRDAVENQQLDGNEQFGFRLRGGAIELQLGAGNWQALTDAGTFTVSEFRIMPTVQTLALDAFCATACTPGSSACPQQQLRALTVVISGRLAGPANVARSLRSTVRLRNDTVGGACPD